jgi:hypothetical protein
VTAVTAVAAAGLVLAYGWWRMPGTGGGALGGGRHVPPAAASSDVGPSGNREIMQGRGYAQHTHIVATTFWVGEVFDPSASDGSQVLSTYDAKWMEHYGGCDGVVRNGVCTTEPRTAANGYFPTAMNPKQNPFYLDLPFDDINNAIARAQRAEVIPWANRPGYAERAADSGFSYMKNRWVKLSRSERTCYGQIQDAGPGRYDDAAYVFGSDDRRPANRRFNGAGLDVSPALNGCLGFQQLNGDSDTVDWSFVDDIDVPDGPWRTIVTTQQVVN